MVPDRLGSSREKFFEKNFCSGETSLYYLFRIIKRNLFKLNEVAVVPPPIFDALAESASKAEKSAKYLSVYRAFLTDNGKEEKHMLISNDSRLFASCGILLYKDSDKTKFIALLASFLIICIEPSATKIYNNIFKLIIKASIAALIKIQHLINILIRCYPKNPHLWVLKEFLLRKNVCFIKKFPYFKTMRLRWLIISDLNLSYLSSDAQLYKKNLLKVLADLITNLKLIKKKS